ncbi:GATA zinc finger domain-containing protein 14-like isoform X2 [Pogonomyrmex barbatus]|uniref:GATA zinc finger domain-containing protein 14-like isoform X2 n=1 Tax=Pogonomyrmex barbatus TaxID=144034 RepID=A0A6I9WTY0_9HYME|nr:GATA zinc finger domain-containing protein 14-like isoform X2 [Pogonomyrmex barbatus]
MCDLIDLNSPDVRGAPEPARLASPLIPAPKSIEYGTGSSSLSSTTTEKRENDGNNPFDQVLHETAEYVSKRGDPFEVMLQRALRTKGRRNAQSVDFTDDFTPRRKKRYLKMNKTLDMLDESLLENRFGLFEGDKKKAEIRVGSINLDTRNDHVYNVADSALVFKQEHKVSVADPESLELSILNQSTMNDTLLETVPKSKKNNETLPCLEKDMLFDEFIFPSSFKLSNIQRSLSQGDRKSSMDLVYANRRSKSVTDAQRKTSQSDSTISSFLDRGFLESKQSEQSVFSTLSNVSSIKLTSISSSVLSVDAMNHAFLDDGSSKTSEGKISPTKSSTDITPGRYDLSDLAERLNKLKCIMNNTTSISNMTENDSSSMKEENNKQIKDNKLIDVDIFIPEHKELNKSSSSIGSSDSVFTNTNKIDKSILNEAKVLARTFQELAIKTDSGSSMDDDLISNNTLWMSELLPAFEDEPVVDNLIDLPVSPKTDVRNVDNSDEKQSPSSIDSMERNLLEEIKSPFADVPVVKQTVTSLLSDLRKLIKTENNSEAKKLLDNLENILDINYKNNTELLLACFNTSNKTQSLQKTPSSESVERSEKSITDKSEEENENEKISLKEKFNNNEKLLPNTDNKLKDSSQDTISSGNSSVIPSSSKDNSENNTNTTNSPDITKLNKSIIEKDNQMDKNVAVQLLINLKKLLSGQAEDDTTIQLLKNIGKALNTALNNSIENKEQTSYSEEQNIQQYSTPIRVPESDCNAHTSALLKASHRQNLESKSKTGKRSRSVIESSPKSTQIRRHRDTSELENRQKRFSSDPGFSNLPNKKPPISETYNTRKGPDNKEKSIAMSDVKNKLKKRSDVINKKGPLKAVHPVDNMQKKEASLGRQTMSSQQVITPPKLDKNTSSGNKIISSTPNSIGNNYYMPKKSARSKPVASSTPDGQNAKSTPQLTTSNKKRNLSCDISPVTAYVNMNGSDERKNSPKKSPKRNMSKLPTPKKCTTPKRQQIDVFAGIPRFSTPPKHNSSFTMHQPQSPQRLNRSFCNSQRYSPIHEKKIARKIQQSPLKETNRITAKVKPFNLISKIKRHSIGDFAEKENSYA